MTGNFTTNLLEIEKKWRSHIKKSELQKISNSSKYMFTWVTNKVKKIFKGKKKTYFEIGKVWPLKKHREVYEVEHERFKLEVR